MKLTVASVGNINIDISFYTRTYPEKDSETEAYGFKLSHGGAAANFAVGVSRLGINCGMVGCVGRDYFGKTAVGSLREEGVWTGWVLECELETGTAGTIVEAVGGTRTMIAWRGANTMLLQAVRRSSLGGTRHIHVSNVPKEVLSEVVKARGNSKVSFDPGGSAKLYNPEDLAGIDFLMLNRSELDSILCGRIGIRDLLSFVGIVVLKQGAQGTTLYGGGRILKQHSFKVNVVDTTGAGDAFDAGFISALLYEEDLQEALNWGAAAAALKIQNMGARAGLPRLEELRTFLDLCRDR